MRFVLSAISALAIGVVSYGCSSGSNASSPGTTSGADSADTDGSIGCATDPRAEDFKLGLTHEGDSKLLSFVITNADFVPPAAENNSWTVKILDASGSPVTNAVLTFPKGSHPSDPWMPDHSHGDTPATATNNNDGTYTITPLYFFMGGIWSTLISAQSGTITDTTTFSVCVGD